MATTAGCIPMEVPFLGALLQGFSKRQQQGDLFCTKDASGGGGDGGGEDEVASQNYLTSSSLSGSDESNRAEAEEEEGEELSEGFLDHMEEAQGAAAPVDGVRLDPLGRNARQVSADHFPGALDGSEVLQKVSRVIEARGFTPDNTLFAQSVCPDEINHEEGDITNLFAEYLGEVFHMGGLAGLPFCGRTGFSAFTHHVPDGGHCFVLMAPHIGISGTHALGRYTRDGQNGQEGAACGAAIGALRHCECRKKLPSAASDVLDYQMNFLIRKVNAVKKQILQRATTQDEKMVALVHEIWKISKSMMLDEIVHAHFGDENSKLVVLTGIQINMPRPYEDMFQPLSFSLLSKGSSKPQRVVRTKKGSKNVHPTANNCVEDLFEETFGHKAPILP